MTNALTHTLLRNILDQPTAREPRLVFADHLDDRGDTLRAAVLQWTVEALEGRPPTDLPALLDQLDPVHEEWARLVGARLAIQAWQQAALSHFPRWLAVAKPCLDLAFGEPDEVQARGGTRYFGDPDLPVDMPWPTYSDCKHWFPLNDGEIDPRSPCRFVAQFHASDLRRSPVAEGLAPHGLLSIFAFIEYEELGITEVCVRWFPNVSTLQRRPHPTDVDEAVARVAPLQLQLTQNLSLPPDDGPWKGWSEGHEPPSVAQRLGLFGYIQPTSGSIELPDRSWQRLSCLPTDPDGVIWNHVAIPSEDLAAGHLDTATPVWADMAG